jgi:hypothetical protein
MDNLAEPTQRLSSTRFHQVMWNQHVSIFLSHLLHAPMTEGTELSKGG